MLTKPTELNQSTLSLNSTDSANSTQPIQIIGLLRESGKFQILCSDPNTNQFYQMKCTKKQLSEFLGQQGLTVEELNILTSKALEKFIPIDFIEVDIRKQEEGQTFLLDKGYSELKEYKPLIEGEHTVVSFEEFKQRLEEYVINRLKQEYHDEVEEALSMKLALEIGVFISLIKCDLRKKMYKTVNKDESITTALLTEDNRVHLFITSSKRANPTHLIFNLVEKGMDEYVYFVKETRGTSKTLEEYLDSKLNE